MSPLMVQYRVGGGLPLKKKDSIQKMSTAHLKILKKIVTHFTENNLEINLLINRYLNNTVAIRAIFLIFD